MRPVRAVLCMLLIVVGSTRVLAQGAYVGTTGFGFLKVGASARPSAVAGAFVAVPGDLSGLRWNPALGATLEGRQGVLSYTDYLVDTQAGLLAAAWPAKRVGNVGASFSYMSYGDMARTSSQGDTYAESPFGASDVSVQCTLSRWVRPRVAVGAGLKAVFSKIDTYSSDAYALDLGVFYSTPLRGLSVGASAANLVGVVRKGYTSEHKDELPVGFRLGFSHVVAHLPLTLMGQWQGSTNDSSSSFALGGEFAIAESLFLRTGYQDAASDVDGSGRAGWSMGGGVRWRSYRFDYAHSTYGALGGVHRVSLAGSL